MPKQLSVVATNLIGLRKSRGLNQAEFASRAGISLRTFQNYESDHRVPSLAALINIAEKFNVPVDGLLRWHLLDRPAPPIIPSKPATKKSAKKTRKK